MSQFSKLKVAVLRGGPSYGYDASLHTGGHVLSLLHEMPENYEPLDILISKDGEWHYGGIVHEPHRALRHADVVWNALYGAYGEDGQVQRVLEPLHIPFTGSSAVASAISMNKEMAKQVYRASGMHTPQHELITEDKFNDDILLHIFRTYLHPVIVKPANASGSVGVKLAHTLQEVKEAIKAAFSHSKKVMVEERIVGQEASCLVVENARGERYYPLLPIPMNFLPEVHREIERMAKQAHQGLGLRHYSTSDFIVTPRNKVYILETNSQPLLHEQTHAHRSLESVGWKQHDFVDHIIRLAVNKN
ncbi:MAG: hypothetical protein Q8O98_00410 [bacterium]|nr:hypothetical protein [bacterium]